MKADSTSEYAETAPARAKAAKNFIKVFNIKKFIYFTSLKGFGVY